MKTGFPLQFSTRNVSSAFTNFDSLIIWTLGCTLPFLFWFFTICADIQAYPKKDIVVVSGCQFSMN